MGNKLSVSFFMVAFENVSAAGGPRLERVIKATTNGQLTKKEFHTSEELPRHFQCDSVSIG